MLSIDSIGNSYPHGVKPLVPSLQILQPRSIPRVLVFAVWYHVSFCFKPVYSVIIQLEISLAFDIGLTMSALAESL